MATYGSQFFQPNVGAQRWANTGTLIRPAAGAPPTPFTPMTIGSPTSPVSTAIQKFNPAPAPVNSTTSADFNLLRKTKNPLLESANSSLIGRLATTSSANQNELANFTAKLLQNQPGADAALNQETRSIEDVFSGKLAADLAGARDKYATGARQATQQAIADANAARKSASIGSGIGGGSYFNRQAIAAGIAPGAALAADLANRERQDIGAVRDAQGRLIGVRNKIATDAANNLLLPAQARAAMVGQDIQNLHGATSLDQANNFYGLADLNAPAPFNPANYPVGGMNSGGGSVSGGSFLSPQGGNRVTQGRDQSIAALISRLGGMERQYQGGAPAPATHDYFNDPGYDLSPEGWTPHTVAPAQYDQWNDPSLALDASGNYVPNAGGQLYDQYGAVER